MSKLLLFIGLLVYLFIAYLTRTVKKMRAGIESFFFYPSLAPSRVFGQ